MKYNVSEVFYTLQGEGPQVGMPSIFVRLSGCNLRCSWAGSLCDTPYTSWNPEVNMMDLETLLKLIGALSSEHDCLNVVLTGGEPTIQNIEPLCDALALGGFQISIETNGTGKVPESVSVVVCSPKLRDSIPEGDQQRALHKSRKDLKILPSWNLKFVVGDETDIDEIDQIVKDSKVPKERVHLMPEGFDEKTILERGRVVAELAKKKGYWFSTRLHVLLWGYTRAT